MKISFSKTNIIQALLLIVVVLLGANIILERFINREISPSQKEITSQTINKNFLTALYNYNLDSSWIMKIKPSKDQDDSLKYFYNVSVPADLPISLLIKEIKDQFDTNEVNIYAADIKSEASVEMKINSGKYLKLEARLNTSDKIKRPTDSIAFLITGIEDLNSEKLNELLMLPEHFCCVLLPSKHSRDIAALLNGNLKQTAILLNDDINELEFKLKSNYPDSRIRNSLKSINDKFNNAAFFIIDENSDIFKSHHYQAIKGWLGKKGLFTENKFKDLIFSSDNIFSILKSDSGKQNLFKVSAEDFLDMPPVLASLRKIGYKFVNPSELLKSQD